MNYPKIENLWKRNTKHLLTEGEHTLSEFANVNRWEISEKIDGMNIKIEFINDSFLFDAVLSFGGRTDKTEIPSQLLKHLEETFSLDFFKEVFPGANNVVIFGEGYGPKIQKGGGKYRKDQGFIGFDIFINGWWMTQQKVYDTLSNVGISVVPHLGRGTIRNIVDFVKQNPTSCISKEPKEMEGIVARSYPLMLFRNGNPVMFKLKVIDYKKLEEKKRKDEK